MKGKPVRLPAARSAKAAANSADVGRQAQKSQATQRAVLDAAIRCLVEFGYTHTTMESIAGKAKISRGAIMHHYASRADVIACTAHYLASRRLDEFARDVCVRLAAARGSEPPTRHSFRMAAELVMQHYERPSFTALHELLLAARTDRAIAPLMKRIEKHLSTRMLALIVEHLPYWESMPAAEALLTDLLHFLARGVAMSHTNRLDRQRQGALLDLVSEVSYERFMAGLEAGRLQGPGSA